MPCQEYTVKTEFTVLCGRVNTKQEIEPEFIHCPKASIPNFDYNDTTIKLMVGELFGHQSPVITYSPMFYVEASLAKACEIKFPFRKSRNWHLYY
jgi:redox-sensitive bicupin YhaK (pirin superfamily)